ncbi:MAG TPA: hypothetical protein VFY34_05955 [Pyrinomonadaceae bacterium]|nr:hypothetical protein [Pyrinomonadaceae bacterium]
MARSSVPAKDRFINAEGVRQFQPAVVNNHGSLEFANVFGVSVPLIFRLPGW